MSNNARRNILKAALIAPLALLLPSLVFAKDAPKAGKPAKDAPKAGKPAKDDSKTGKPANALPETDPLANAMKYKEDATKAGPERADKKAVCSNCAKFNKCSPADTTCRPGAKNAAYAPCEIFSGKQVASPGWCMSWTKLG
jgi:hypothetical protein